MSKKLTLLQEAFLEAEELKKTAIKDAETAIRESLAPKLTSILARQLAEDLDEEMASDDDEEKLDETSHESEEDKEKVDEKKEKEMPEEEEEAEVDAEEDKADESFDIDALLAEMEAEDEEKVEEAKEEDEEMDEAKKDDSEDEEDMDEEFDLNAILETEDEDSEEEKVDEAGKENTGLITSAAEILKKVFPGIDVEKVKKFEKELKAAMDASTGGPFGVTEKKEKSEEDVEEKSKEVDELKETLKEVNLMNIKLLYPTKIAFNYDLSKKQKKIVLEAFDGVKSKKEAELVFETLSNVLKDSKTKPQNKQTLKENLGFPSSSKGDSTKQVITEADEFKLKMQKRAGIIK